MSGAKQGEYWYHL